MSSPPLDLSQLDAFAEFSSDDLALLSSRLVILPVARGVALVDQGAESDELYIVISGRFAVEVEGHDAPIAEIASGDPIGEIGFFAGSRRTATVRAIRDSVVVRLTRRDLADIAQLRPAISQLITAALARRLTVETKRSATFSRAVRRPRARTIAVVPAGPNPISPIFLTAFQELISERPGTLIVSSETIRDHVSSVDVDGIAATKALNDLEQSHDMVIFLAGPQLDAWSEKAIRQADEILLVASTHASPVGRPVEINAVERQAFSLHTVSARKLVLVHPTRHALQGTRHWLACRDVDLHFHVNETSLHDIGRLCRFLRGEALGFVACGGGAYCSAHIGIYKAFKQRNITFDYFGGTSGGAAMTAAFAQDLASEEIEQRVHRMFIDGKAMGRYTLPRYSLLDHTHFDRHLIAEYGHVNIEDIWKPFFAVSTDLSDYSTEVHRRGPVWQAVRASAAIPALLPPFYTGDGRMLVDGSVLSNVPLDIMHALKSGPNVVVNFSAPTGDRFDVNYDQLPARRELLTRMFLRFGSRKLPDAPSAATVLVRSLMANRSHFERLLGPEDWLLTPPIPAGMGALDWSRYREVVELAYQYTLREIDEGRGTFIL